MGGWIISVDEFDENEVQELRERGRASLERIKPLKNLHDELRMGLEEKEWKKNRDKPSFGI